MKLITRIAIVTGYTSWWYGFLSKTMLLVAMVTVLLDTSRGITLSIFLIGFVLLVLSAILEAVKELALGKITGR